MITTGNLFGIAIGWPEAFYNKAIQIIKETGDDMGDDCDYATNPAFAGAWVTCYKKETAEKISAAWRQMLPLAVRSMSPKWREEYENDRRKLQILRNPTPQDA